MANDYEVFKGKDLSQLFRDIYNNQRTTASQITILIDSLRPLIKNAGDAAVIVPLIRDYLDVSVKNDSHIVRLAAIVERLYAAEKLTSSEGGIGMLSEDEKAALMLSAENELKQIRGGHADVQKQLDTTKSVVKELTAGSDDESDSDDDDNTDAP